MYTSILVASLFTAVSALQMDPFANFVPSFNISNNGRLRSLCGADDSTEAKCSIQNETLAYNAAKAVLRITIKNVFHCTGWLIGDQGHVITNAHCINVASQAADLTFEAMAEGPDCATDCRRPRACPGIVIHTTPLSFIATGGTLENDWTLLQLNESEFIRRWLLNALGFLQIRKSGSVVGERIYVAGHPEGHGKRLSLNDGSNFGSIISRNQTTGCGSSEVIYKVDTLGGSSGSPVLAHSDNLVVALHHCGGNSDGGCSIAGNSAVDADILYEGMKDFLPASAFV
jgi:lysyl endopeptidase